MKTQVIINENCVGCGLCEEITGGIFKLNRLGIAEVVSLYYDEKKIKEAIENCPFNAIGIRGEEKKSSDIKVSLENSTYLISDGVRHIKVNIDKNGRVSLNTNGGQIDFRFVNSKPEMVEGIAKLLLKAAHIIKK